MAAAHWRGAGRVLVRPLRQPRTGNQHTTPANPTATGPSSLLRISRRLPASSSPVLAAARLRALQRDSWPARREGPAATRKDPEEQSAQPGGSRSHRVRFVCPLDSGGPYGCRIAGVASSDRYAVPGILIPVVRADPTARGTPQDGSAMRPDRVVRPGGPGDLRCARLLWLVSSCTQRTAPPASRGQPSAALLARPP
jgi:hypothetical protein